MDSYDILNVTRDSSDKEIEIAYEDLKRKYDPSFNTSIHAYKKYREIVKAYECIKDEQRRKMYDLKENINQDIGGDKDVKLYDYNKVRESSNNVSIDYSKVESYSNVSKQDKEVEIQVSYLYKLLNLRYDLEYVRDVICKECSEFITCPSCGGEKVVECQKRIVWCPTCKGSGKVSVNCKSCGGSRSSTHKDMLSFYVDDDFKEFKGLGDEQGEYGRSNLKVRFVFYDKNNIEVSDDAIKINYYLSKKETFEGISKEYFSEIGAFKIEIPSFVANGYQKEVYFNNKKIVFTFYNEKYDGENIVRYLFINKRFKDKYIYFSEDYSFCNEEEKIDCSKMVKCESKIVVEGFGNKGLYGGVSGNLIINVIFNNDSDLLYTDKVKVVNSSRVFNLLGGRLDNIYHYGFKRENALVKKGDVYYYLSGDSKVRSKLKNYFLFKIICAFLWVLIPCLLLVIPYGNSAFISCIISLFVYIVLVNFLMEVEV